MPYAVDGLAELPFQIFKMLLGGFRARVVQADPPGGHQLRGQRFDAPGGSDERFAQLFVAAGAASGDEASSTTDAFRPRAEPSGFVVQVRFSANDT